MADCDQSKSGTPTGEVADRGRSGRVPRTSGSRRVAYDPRQDRMYRRAAGEGDSALNCLHSSMAGGLRATHDLFAPYDQTVEDGVVKCDDRIGPTGT